MSINYTAATMAVLDALGRDPDSSYHVRAVAEEAGVSVGAASMVLHALEHSGLLTVEVRGNMKLYQYNLSNPVARQWKVLFTVNRLKRLVDALIEEAQSIILFGSAADGTDTRESDIDLFILSQREGAVKMILREFQKEFLKKYQRALSPIIMNAAGYARLRRQDPSLYESIVRGRVLWETLSSPR